MNLLTFVCILFAIIQINCNPITEVTSNGESEGMTEVFSTTEVVKKPEEDIEISTDVEVLEKNTESPNSCSHCLSDKYLKHYYAKGCKPIFDENCINCPKMFDCDKKVEVVLGNNECLYNGTKYTIGEPVPMDNPCQVCQCGYGFTHRYSASGFSSPFTTIHCITIECPEHFAVHSYPVAGLEKDFEAIKNCYNIYEPKKCCAVAKKCPGNIPVDEKVCPFEDKIYRIGEKIYPNEDKCKICICDEDWDPIKGLNNSGCNDLKCNLEIDRQLIDGCIPVYHENTCCPIDYYCPEREQSIDDFELCTEPSDSGPCVGDFSRFYFDVLTGVCRPFIFGGCGGNQNNFRSLEECQRKCVKTSHKTNETKVDKEVEDISDHNFCKFNDHKYAIGDKLDIGQRCVSCECRVPPDFTCIHKSCPRPTTNNCKVSYNPLSCCPLYDCHYNKTDTKIFDPLSCPTPMCDKGCVFETYPDRCPTCVCKPGVDDREVPDYDISDI